MNDPRETAYELGCSYEMTCPYSLGFFLGAESKQNACYHAGKALELNHFGIMSSDWLEFNRGWKDAY